jgi:hypothetical protein
VTSCTYETIAGGILTANLVATRLRGVAAIDIALTWYDGVGRNLADTTQHQLVTEDPQVFGMLKHFHYPVARPVECHATLGQVYTKP